MSKTGRASAQERGAWLSASDISTLHVAENRQKLVDTVTARAAPTWTATAG